MAGLFDDLIPVGGTPAGPTPPTAAPPAAASPTSGGMFDDLVPSAGAPPLTITPNGVAPAPPADPNQVQPGDASAAVGQGILDLPVVGPGIKWAMNPALAKLRSMHEGTSYDQALNEVNQFEEGTAAAHPYATAAGQVLGTGAAMAPLAAAAPAAFGLEGSIGARAALSGATGSGVGAADSYVRGQDPITGAALGAAGGAAAPLAGAAAGAVVRGVGGAMQQVPPELQGLGKTARQWLADGLGDATPENLAAAKAAVGPAGMVADLTPKLTDYAGSVADNNGPGKAIVRDAYQGRMDARNQRVNDLVDSNLGPAQSPLQYSSGLLSQASDLAQQRNGILAQTGHIDISPVVQQLQSQIQSTAPNSPQRQALNEALGWITTPSPTPGAPPVPISDPMQLHSAKQALDNAIDYDSRGLAVPNSAINGAQGGYKGARAGINDALRAASPDYAANQDATSSLMRQQANVRAGTQDLRAGTSAQNPADYGPAFGALPPEEQAARRVGIRGAVDQALGTRPNDFQALKAVTQGENGWNGQNLATAFGPDAADAVNQGISQEDQIARNTQKVIGGSPTGEKLERNQLTQPEISKGFLGYLANMRPLDQPATMLPPFMHPTNIGEKIYGKSYEQARAQIAPLLVSQGADADGLTSALMQVRDRQAALAGAGKPVDGLVQALIAASAPTARRKLLEN